MFSPLRVWRKWHRRVNVGHKRYAVASALAASALPALVMARGHAISQISEVPLVVANESMEGLLKTKKATAVLKALRAYDDVQRVKDTKKRRAGRGKMRNRPYKERVGPLIIYGGNGSNICPSFRNIPGVELVSVHALNLLRLAPGGHIGRFCVWTRGAFEQLDTIFGTNKTASQTKKNYRLPFSSVTNPDVDRVMSSDSIRAVFRAPRVPLKFKRHINPLRHTKRLHQLNPYIPIQHKLAVARDRANRAKNLKAKEERKNKPPQPHKQGPPKRNKKFVNLLRA